MTTSDNISAIEAIEKAAKAAADAIGVTPHSDMRIFVEQAVKYALSAEVRKAEALEREIAEKDAALQAALVAMKLAAALPRVAEEYDFSHAIQTAADALATPRTMSFDLLNPDRVRFKFIPVSAQEVMQAEMDKIFNHKVEIWHVDRWEKTIGHLLPDRVYRISEAPRARTLLNGGSDAQE